MPSLSLVSGGLYRVMVSRLSLYDYYLMSMYNSHHHSRQEIRNIWAENKDISETDTCRQAAGEGGVILIKFLSWDSVFCHLMSWRVGQESSYEGRTDRRERLLIRAKCECFKVSRCGGGEVRASASLFVSNSQQISVCDVVMKTSVITSD